MKMSKAGKTVAWIAVGLITVFAVAPVSYEAWSVWSARRKARYHAARLAAGDFRHGGTMAIPEIPYHLHKLIELGPDSAEELIKLLYNERATPYQRIYFTGHEITMHETRNEPPKDTRATVGYMANYALQSIFNRGIPYRVYLGKKEREAAILKWKGILAKHEAENTIIDRMFQRLVDKLVHSQH